MKGLAKRGIGTRPFFYPIHLQPVLKKRGLFNNERFPVAENLYNNGFYIPSGLALKKDQIFKVTNNISNIIHKGI